MAKRDTDRQFIEKVDSKRFCDTYGYTPTQMDKILAEAIDRLDRLDRIVTANGEQRRLKKAARKDK